MHVANQTDMFTIPQHQLFVGHNGASDELLHDLVATAIDGLHSGVQEGSGDGVLQHVPPSAMQLHTLGSHLVLQIGDPATEMGHEVR